MQSDGGVIITPSEWGVLWDCGTSISTVHANLEETYQFLRQPEYFFRNVRNGVQCLPRGRERPIFGLPTAGWCAPIGPKNVASSPDIREMLLRDVDTLFEATAKLCMFLHEHKLLDSGDYAPTLVYAEDRTSWPYFHLGENQSLRCVYSLLQHWEVLDVLNKVIHWLDMARESIDRTLTWLDKYRDGAKVFLLPKGHHLCATYRRMLQSVFALYGLLEYLKGAYIGGRRIVRIKKVLEHEKRQCKGQNFAHTPQSV